MAFLKQTYVSGGLFVTGSENFISASVFKGALEGTASNATSASYAVTASQAGNINPDADATVKTLHVSGNAQIDGDLKVLGELTYMGVQDLRVHDKTIELNVDDSGSAQGSVDGAGIIMKGIDTNVELIYTGSKLHVNQTIAGTIDTASLALNAEQADKVAHKVAFKLTGQDGTAASPVEFDGSEAKDFEVDLSGLESKTHASASVADLQDQINAISGESGSGSITERIQAAIEALDADASVSATGTPESGGVFVLTGVAINEADGKLTSGSQTSVEVEKAGEAAKAKAELLGASTDATSSMTLYGVRKYAETEIAAKFNELSSSVEVDITNVMLSQSNASQSISQSIATGLETAGTNLNTVSESISQSVATVAANALNLVESSSWIAVSPKADNKQTISAKTQSVADANATTANGLALAADVKSYVDSQVGGKNVDAVGDEYITLEANDNVVSGSAVIKAIADATASKQGLVDAYDAKLHVSASVAEASASAAAALAGVSASVATDLGKVAATASRDLNDFSGSVATDFETAASASAAALNTFSASVEADFTAAKSDLTTTASALDTKISNVEATASAAYVKKAGDTMTGDLNMAANGIKFGDLRMVWNATDGAIEFIDDSASE